MYFHFVHLNIERAEKSISNCTVHYTLFLNVSICWWKCHGFEKCFLWSCPLFQNLVYFLPTSKSRFGYNSLLSLNILFSVSACLQLRDFRYIWKIEQWIMVLLKFQNNIFEPLSWTLSFVQKKSSLKSVHIRFYIL